jgi:ADP-heptose:LPS heptosyltransferase
MNTTFIINGGAGRVITAIPALEKYHRLNPKDDFKVIIHGWDSLYWSHPILQKRTFGSHQKGLFDLIIRDTKLCVPEPYQNNRFYNQKISLVEAFDEEINNTKSHVDLELPKLYLSSIEDTTIKDFIEHEKSKQRKRKVIVFQPYGSGVNMISNQPIDNSNRSLSQSNYFEIIKALSKDAIIFYASHGQFRHINDNISISFDDKQPYLRVMIGLIKNCDYFVGIDSVGQHIARSFNKPGSILMGATNEINFSYPDHFDIFRKSNRDPIYSPWRVAEPDCEFANRENDAIMDFTKDELYEIITSIQEKIGPSTTIKTGDTSICYD